MNEMRIVIAHKMLTYFLRFVHMPIGKLHKVFLRSRYRKISVGELFSSYGLGGLFRGGFEGGQELLAKWSFSTAAVTKSRRPHRCFVVFFVCFVLFCQ
jgi:hypothetical protein